MTAFTKLKYPKGYLVNMKMKAIKIRKRSATTKPNKNERYITLPNSKPAETIARQLETTGFKIAFSSGKKVGDMLTKKKTTGTTTEKKSVVYQIPCGSCTKVLYR